VAVAYLILVRSCARSTMNLRWLTITLLCIAAVLVFGAAVIFFRGGLSFRSETQTSDDTYQIRHTLILSHSALFPAVVGILLFASSLIVPTKRV
jgi:hypothetical protein